MFGLLPFYSSKNFELNLPNKFSEYLSAGLIIGSSVGGEMEDQISTHQCGFKFDLKEKYDLLEHMSSIINEGIQTEIKLHSQALHKQMFDSTNVYPRIVDHIEDVAAHYLEG